MKTIASKVFILAAFVAAPLGAQENASPSPEGRVLLLQNERGLEGNIERVGDRYRVRRGAGEMWVPAEKALRLCADWNDAYEFMKKRVNLGDPDERLRLARWCQLHNLRSQALAEAQAALDMRPAHLESGKLVTMLAQVASASSSVPASVAPPKTTTAQPAKANPRTKAAPASADISSDAFAVFATRVQPILMNTCVSCHSGGRGGDFQLVATDGSQRGITQANLASVLDQLRTDNLVLSPLFIKAVSRHGNCPSAPIKDRQAVPLKTMQAWVEYLLTTNPHLKYRETDVAAASKKAEPVTFAQSRLEPPTLGKHETPPRRENATVSPLPPPPVGGAAEQQTQARNSDPFDPETFNRQAASRQLKRE